MPNAIYILLIVFLPLATFVLLGLFGKKYFNHLAGMGATVMLLVATCLSFYTAYGYFFKYGYVNGVYQKIMVFKYTWLSFSNGMSIDMGAILDPISAMMLVVVPFISLMVHIYSLSYLKGEERVATYYAFLGLFTFSMLGLVLSANIFQMYFFWELVGVSSFLLIGFYYQKPSAVAACKKAFIVTRFADLGFLIGILILSYHAHSFDFGTIIQQLTTKGNSSVVPALLGVSALSWGTALLFIGAAGKSALFPLHIWLPDAMEGPTPVSALIHAATMVVAGVFLVARLFPLFSLTQSVMQVLAFIGAFTALFAAVIACTQSDIKRVLAYSTMSQIGFMILALGVASTKHNLGFTASLFHLFTHAMFKALLFLGAGVVIHFVHSNEMKDMGGLKKLLPITHFTFLIACLAIAGIPPFAGFFSKEEILLAAYQSNTIIFYSALITSALTAFYMFRLYFKIFWHHTEDMHTAHNTTTYAGTSLQRQGGFAMVLPLIVLAVATCIAGFIPFGLFVSSNGKPIHASLHLSFSIAPVAMALLGIVTAWWLYKTKNGKAATIATSLNGFYRAAVQKFYIDEIYNFVTHKIIFNLFAQSAAWFDKYVVDGLVNATGNNTARLSVLIKKIQSGKVQQYAICFLVGAIGLAVLFIYLWK